MIATPRVMALHLGSADVVPSACQLYRTNLPFTYLNALGNWDVRWAFADEIAADFQQRGRAAWQSLVDEYDVFVIPRACAPTPQHLEATRALIQFLRLSGKRVVYEVDDDLTNKYRDLSHKGILEAMTIAKWCDAVTVTTPALAEIMRKETKRPVYAMNNMVDPHPWDLPSEREIDVDAPLIIGLSGSASHENDWRVMEPVFRKLLAQGLPIQLWVTAYHPDYLKDLPNTLYLPALDYHGYVQVVRGSDIVLAPVDPADSFNLGKSPIKAVEGMAASRYLSDGSVGGACVLATRHPVYRTAVEHEMRGLLVDHTPEAWEQALLQVIENRTLRERLQRNAHSWVWKHHNIRTEWTRWAQAYTKIWRAPANTVRLYDPKDLA